MANCRLFLSQDHARNQAHEPTENKDPHAESSVWNVKSPKQLGVDLVQESTNQTQHEGFDNFNSANKGSKSYDVCDSASNSVNERVMSKKLDIMFVTCALSSVVSILAVVDETDFGNHSRLEKGFGIVGITCTSFFPESFDEEIVLDGEAENKQG